MATTWWVDPVGGDNTTGDGSYSTPYKTINKAISIMADGDTIKVYDTGAHTTVSGATFGFTKYSNEITTSADMTGSFSVGDYIGKTTAAGNGADESFYRISAITSSKITIDINYYGSTESPTSVYKATIISTGEVEPIVDQDRNFIGGFVSGGWDSETTQNGETWLIDAGSNGQFDFQYVTYAGYAYEIDHLNAVDVLNFRKLTAYGGDETYSYCTTYGTGYNCSSSTSNQITQNNCCITGKGSSNFTYNSTVTCTDCIFRNTKTGEFVHTGGLYPETFTNCKIQGFNEVTSSGNYGYAMTFTGCTIEDCNYGFVGNLGGNTATDCNFINNTYCIFPNTTNHGFYLENCTFTDNGRCFNAYSGCDVYFSNCTFTGNDYGYYPTSQYVEGTCTFTNCTFDNFTNYVVYSINSIPMDVKILDCSITAGEEATLLYDPNVSANFFHPRFTLVGNETNSVWPDGAYYGWYSMTKSNDYRSTYPSLQIVNKATTSYVQAPIKIFSTYVKSGEGKAITFYHKQAAGWQGSIVFESRVNGALVKTFTSDEISSPNTDWTQLTLTTNDVEVEHDGELAIYARYTGNTFAWYVDDFTVVDV